MIKTNIFSRLIVITFLLFSFSYLSAQETLSTVDDRIKELSKETEYIPLDSAYARGISVQNFLDKSYLEINLELQDQLYLLTNLEFGSSLNQDSSPTNNPDGGGRNTLYQSVLSSKARIDALITEVNQVAKLGKIKGVEIKHPFQVLTDRQLRTIHHQLIKVYAQEIQHQGNENTTKFFVEYISQAEIELQARGFFPVRKEGIPNFNNKLARRFLLIEEVNRQARLEASYLVDNSPMVLEAREKVELAMKELRAIDRQLGIVEDKLPHFRDIITNFTAQERINILERGKLKAELTFKIKRQYGIESKVLATTIEKQAIEEKKWLYTENFHKVIYKGRTTRGPPPNTPPNFNFYENPSPKPPSDGGGLGSGSLSLDKVLDTKKIDKIDRKTQKAFFLANNLSNPNWKIIKNTPLVRSDFTVTTDISHHLKSLAIDYYRNLPINPTLAQNIDIEFKTTIRHLFPQESTLNKFDFIGNDLRLLNNIEETISLAQKIKAKRITELGPLAQPWNKKEVIFLNTTLDEIKEAQIRAKNYIALLSPNQRINVDLFNKPPPNLGKIIYNNNITVKSLDNEAFYLKVANEQKLALEKLKATYGIDAPPSIAKRLSEIKEMLTINNASKVLGMQRELAPHLTKMKAIETGINNKYISQELKSFLDNFEKMEVYYDIKAKQTIFNNNILSLYQDIENSKSPILTKELYRDIKLAKKSIPKDRLGKRVNTRIEDWRLPQDIEKLEAMKFSKDPGGIWLSPNGMTIKSQIDFLPEQNWLTISINEACPTEKNYYEWILDETTNKICFPNLPASKLSFSHWTNQLPLWF